MKITTVFHELHAELFTYIRTKVRSKADAEDLFQNVFIKVVSHIGQLKEEEKIKGWIFNIAKNAITDYYRIRASQHRIVDKHIPEVAFKHDEISYVAHGLEQCIMPMITQLPVIDQQVIIDSELRGLKQKEVAKMHGIAYSSLRSRIQRGRQKLKKLLLQCCQIKTNHHGNIMGAQRHETSKCSGLDC